MKKLILPLFAAACCMVPLSTDAKKVHTIGDSTMAEYSPDRVTKGWGQMFQQFFTSDITVNNRAKSGASSKSFYLEAPYWTSVKTQIEPGDYVIIQFAHNDEKNSGMDGDEVIAYYKSIGDNATASSTDYRGTTASNTYKEYLRKYVNETRALGATPILCGAICREYFSSGKIRRNGRHDLGDNFSLLTDGGILTGQKVDADDHTYDYPYQMKLVAEEMDVPFIDLTTATKDLYESYGAEMCNSLLFDGDGSTHTSAMGATLIARLAARLLQQQGILTEYINLTSELSINPATLDFGNAYRGQQIVKDVYVSGFDLTPATGTVTVTAPAGITLSTDKATWAESISLSYEGGNLIGTFYACCDFNFDGALSGNIDIVSGAMKATLPVTAECVVLEGGIEATAYWRLEKNDECSVDGPITSLGQSFSNMYVQRYSNPNANTTWPEWTGFEATRKTQRCLIEGDAWPAGEIDEVSNRWIEFAVKAATGTKLNVDNISLFTCGCGGNGMRCKIYYSTDNDFANPVEMKYFSAMAANKMEYVEVTPVLSIEGDQALRIRVYPWYNGAATGKTICLSDIKIHGVASESSALSTITAQQPVAYEYYNLQGMPVAPGSKGVNIRRTIYSDGSCTTAKIIF